MEFTKENTVAFTGNRTLTPPAGASPIGLETKIRSLLFNLLEERYKAGKTCFISGMAVGFDLLAAEVVIELKKRYPDIILIAAIPFMGQDLLYSDKDRGRYREASRQADHHELVWTGDYASKAYHLRNDWMIAHASEVIAYHNGHPRSGTASTIRKATENTLQVTNVYSLIG